VVGESGFVGENSRRVEHVAVPAARPGCHPARRCQSIVRTARLAVEETPLAKRIGAWPLEGCSSSNESGADSLKVLNTPRILRAFPVHTGPGPQRQVHLLRLYASVAGSRSVCGRSRVRWFGLAIGRVRRSGAAPLQPLHQANAYHRKPAGSVAGTKTRSPVENASGSEGCGRDSRP